MTGDKATHSIVLSLPVCTYATESCSCRGKMVKRRYVPFHLLFTSCFVELEDVYENLMIFALKWQRIPESSNVHKLRSDGIGWEHEACKVLTANEGDQLWENTSGHWCFELVASSRYLYVITRMFFTIGNLFSLDGGINIYYAIGSHVSNTWCHYNHKNVYIYFSSMFDSINQTLLN